MLGPSLPSASEPVPSHTHEADADRKVVHGYTASLVLWSLPQPQASEASLPRAAIMAKGLQLLLLPTNGLVSALSS